jgi:hypothetical protein
VPQPKAFPTPHDGALYLYWWELLSMSEYSCSLPSGQVMWKMWRCNPNFGLDRPHHEHRDDTTEVGECHLNDEPKYDLTHLQFLREPWVVRQYVPSNKKGFIGINVYEVHLKSGPHPRGYNAPDWDNYERYKKERQAEDAGYTLDP